MTLKEDNQGTPEVGRQWTDRPGGSRHSWPLIGLEMQVPPPELPSGRLHGPGIYEAGGYMGHFSASGRGSVQTA